MGSGGAWADYAVFWRWAAALRAVGAWLAGLDDGFLNRGFES